MYGFLVIIPFLLLCFPFCLLPRVLLFSRNGVDIDDVLIVYGVYSPTRCLLALLFQEGVGPLYVCSTSVKI